MRTTILYAGGVYCIAFAVFHLFFWKVFGWKSDLPRLRPVNRAIMQVLNIRLTYVFLVGGIMIFQFPGELLSTGIGSFILASASIFWFLRAIEQLFFFATKENRSVAFFFIFLLGSALFLYPLLTV
jgi:hypothetical protein